MHKILFVFSNFSSFVAKDYEILSSAYKVRKYRFRAIKGLVGTGLGLIKQFLFFILNIWRYKAVYVWFADYHSFLPVLFAKVLNKKSYVVVGGYDVSYLPEYNYGSFNRPIRKYFARKTLRLATICFPVAVSLEEKIRKISPESNIEVLPTGTDNQQFIISNYDRAKTVITVASTANYQRAMIKGLDRFAELAVTMPDFEFIIIGVHETFLSFFDPMPVNLKLIPFVPYNELPDYFNNASFYAQFSRSEGLPNSLCEAMLCGCIPLGMDVGDIKLTIEGIGLLLHEWTPGEILGFLRQSHINTILRDRARKRIIEMYDPEIRKKRLIELI
jgi:glycosyltransferase involved in cell wall biosynthesis